MANGEAEERVTMMRECGEGTPEPIEQPRRARRLGKVKTAGLSPVGTLSVSPTPNAPGILGIPNQGVPFGLAMLHVCEGRKARRVEWGENPSFVFLRGGLLHIQDPAGLQHVLTVSDGDILGTDWIVYGEVTPAQ